VTGVEVVIGHFLPVYMALLSKYSASEIIGSRPWPFGVTWYATWQRNDASNYSFAYLTL